MRHAIPMVAIIVPAAVPGSASAATCADFPNQAAAQRAANTRDGDGDGIYCESLPCPCLKPRASRRRPSARPRRRAQRISARIIDVIDGDTIKVRAYGARRRRYSVRLLGIDTPDTERPDTPVQCGGPQASASMLRLGFTAPTDRDGDGLQDTRGGGGRRVTLTTDPTQATFDRYDRLLAYVTTISGVDLQTAQLSRGWAKTYVFGRRPYRRVASFRRAERRARDAGRGVWGMCGGNFHRAA